jgi:hypothetical protein
MLLTESCSYPVCLGLKIIAVTSVWYVNLAFSMCQLQTQMYWAWRTNVHLDMQECQAKAMHMYPAASEGGYLVAADDTLVDVCAISHLPFHKPWYARYLEFF